MLLHSWMQRRKAAFTENSQKMQRLLENLQQKLNEAFLNIQLYEKALDLFEDDQSTTVLLHKHLIRTAVSPMVGILLVNLDIHNKLCQGIQVDDSQNSGMVSLTYADRLTVAKGLSDILGIAMRDLAMESG